MKGGSEVRSVEMVTGLERAREVVGEGLSVAGVDAMIMVGRGWGE